MKKAFIILSFLVILLIAMYAIIKNLWIGDTMSHEKVCATWGSAPLNLAKFKEVGDRVRLFYSQDHLFTPDEQKLWVSPPDPAPIRAKMACSLLKSQKKFYGKDVTEIRDLFGDYTGHYFVDRSPAYIIGPVSAQDKNTWQVVFLINRKDKIKKIIVHKNCCS